MRDLYDIANWLAQGRPHEVKVVDSLPSPTFRLNGQMHVSFSTNNYLGLSSSRRLISAARQGLDHYGVGNCESRLLGGNLAIYETLERRLATLKGTERSILFATGYLTNLGVLSSLPRAGQYARIYGYRARATCKYAYFSDEFNHLSIREGIRMSGADFHRFRHGDLDHLETLLQQSNADSRIIVTDGVFSQDGDIADLPGLLALAERYDAMLYVDDAHGTGILGGNGRGTSEHFGVKSLRLIHMGTLSKAYGAIGGFVATDAAIAEILRLSCAAYGFTSTLPPDQALAVSDAIDAVQDEPQRRQRLWDNQRYFVSRMARLPYELVSTATPIVPVLIGDEAVADKLAARLTAEHIHVDAVKFPGVPMGKARLRVQMNAGHTREQIDHFVGVLEQNQDVIGAQKPSAKVATFSKPRAATRPWAIAAFTSLVNQRQDTLAAKPAVISPIVAATTALANKSLSLDRPHAQTSLNLLALVTACLIAIDLNYDIPHLIFAYLVPILFIARKFGLISALIATVASVACSAFFLFEPVFSFYIEDPKEGIELIVFAIVACLASYALAKDKPTTG
ncbi:MAG: aminotransferase class I/II-fold pyridoxal phosphate-dependent enzyme [Acidobacteria bacterium]|nr:aminotransferase class I/II-fold pyridoxal phosphate-dependent enzyme [Acidobacteriota bacterium]